MFGDSKRMHSYKRDLVCSMIMISENAAPMTLFHINMLTFDPIRAVSHDFLRDSHYFAIPPKLYKRSEAVVRLGRRAREANRRKATSD